MARSVGAPRLGPGAAEPGPAPLPAPAVPARVVAVRLPVEALRGAAEPFPAGPGTPPGSVPRAEVGVVSLVPFPDASPALALSWVPAATLVLAGRTGMLATE